MTGQLLGAAAAGRLSDYRGQARPGRGGAFRYRQKRGVSAPGAVDWWFRPFCRGRGARFAIWQAIVGITGPPVRRLIYSRMTPSPALPVSAQPVAAGLAPERPWCAAGVGCI